MFAQRLANIDISGIRKMFELAGRENVINLAIGEPDFGIPEEAKEEIIRALEEDFTHYTPNKGIVKLREALVDRFAERGVATSEEEIIVTSGASEALHIAIMALVNPGDEVLIPNPGFVSYAPLVRLAEGKPISLPLKEEKKFIPNPDDIKERITKKTKLLIINSPSNPTGVVFPEKILKEIAEICEDYKLYAISDEVYEEIVYEARHHCFGKFTDKAIVVSGFSKSYAMTGLRLGYVQAELSLIEEMLKIHQYIQASTCSLSQRAALAALKAGEEFVKNMVMTFKRRRDLILSLLSTIEEISVVKPTGAFYVFPNFSAYGESSSLVMEFLKHAQVVTTPGEAFGNYGKGYIRFSYATSEDKIKEGIKRIKDYLEERK